MAALSFFPGSNTCRGFHGFFPELMTDDEMQRVLILKGGPGVGKSTLMKRIGAAWEKQGRQVIYYWCSGDPDSLDAVISGGRMVMDGTAPHVTDPILPGAADGILNLGECLSDRTMAAHRSEVIALQRDMRLCYARAFRYLTGAEAALSDMQAVYQLAVDEGALINLRMETQEFLSEGAKPGRTRHAYAQAVTCKGIVQHLESLEKGDMLCLDLPLGFDADAIFRPLKMNLQFRGAACMALMHPLNGKKHAHVMTDTRAVAGFVQSGQPVRTLPFNEDILRREHDALSFSRAAYNLLLHQATSSLQQAKEKHDVLERIYADAMDYRHLDDLQESAVEKMTEKE